MLYVHFIYADGARQGNTLMHTHSQREREQLTMYKHIKLIYRHFASMNT